MYQHNLLFCSLKKRRKRMNTISLCFFFWHLHFHFLRFCVALCSPLSSLPPHFSFPTSSFCPYVFSLFPLPPTRWSDVNDGPCVISCLIWCMRVGVCQRGRKRDGKVGRRLHGPQIQKVNGISGRGAQLEQQHTAQFIRCRCVEVFFCGHAASVWWWVLTRGFLFIRELAASHLPPHSQAFLPATYHKEAEAVHSGRWDRLLCVEAGGSGHDELAERGMEEWEASG